MSESTTIIAFDQHAQWVMAAVLGPREAEPAVHPLTSDLPTIGRFVKRLLAYGPVRCCYEAGPCGFALQRFLTAHDVPCEVIAPTLIPRRPGDRIKTDRRDAVMLAKLHRAGELTAVWVPDAAHEAMRDLIRARATAVRVLGKARQHLQGFLLRHGRVYAGKKGWTLPYRRWLTMVRFDHPAQQVVLQDYIHSVYDAEERIARLRAGAQALRARHRPRLPG